MRRADIRTICALVLTLTLAVAAPANATSTTDSGTCWQPASEPATATVTWSEVAATGPCTYHFEYLSAFDWVQLSTPDWYYVYVPVATDTDPPAFEYAGRAWTQMSSAPNGPVCGAGDACGGVPLYPDNCDGLTDADWQAWNDYLYITGIYSGDPAKFDLLAACAGW
jgi:hypothetical protein